MRVSPFGFAPFSLLGYGCGVANFVTTLDTGSVYQNYCCLPLFLAVPLDVVIQRFADDPRKVSILLLDDGFQLRSLVGS
jgi:hypothetical protein